MRILAKETVQGSGISGRLVDEDITVSILEPGEIYEVGDQLGDWLLEHNKAETAGASMIRAKKIEVKSDSDSPVHPEEVANDPEPATSEPIMGTGKGKGKK